MFAETYLLFLSRDSFGSHLLSKFSQRFIEKLNLSLKRNIYCRHKHEVESGRTSSVGNDILGFDASGVIVNKPDPHHGHLDWVGICQESSKVITFIDLAGHEKYLKTTIFGMTGHLPDYSMLMVSCCTIDSLAKGILTNES